MSRRREALGIRWETLSSRRETMSPGREGWSAERRRRVSAAIWVATEGGEPIGWQRKASGGAARGLRWRREGWIGANLGHSAEATWSRSGDGRLGEEPTWSETGATWSRGRRVRRGNLGLLVTKSRAGRKSEGE